jgi:hypothetical protein
MTRKSYSPERLSGCLQNLGLGQKSGLMNSSFSKAMFALIIFCQACLLLLCAQLPQYQIILSQCLLGEVVPKLSCHEPLTQRFRMWKLCLHFYKILMMVYHA